MAKRAMDFAVALLGLILLAPEHSLRYTQASHGEIQKSTLEFFFSHARLSQTPLQSEQA